MKACSLLLLGLAAGVQSQRWPAQRWPGGNIPITHRFKYRLAWTEGQGLVDILTTTSVVTLGISKKVRCTPPPPTGDVAVEEDSAKKNETVNATPEGDDEGPETDEEVTLRRRAVDTTDCSAAQLQREVSKTATEVIRMAQKMDGFEGVSTGGLTLSIDEEAGPNGKQQFVGYSSNLVLTIYIDTKHVSDILDGALAAGVTTVDNVDFFISDQQLAKAQIEGLQLAVKDCYTQAGIAVTALKEGVEVAEPLRVDIADMGQTPFVNTPVSLTNSGTIDPNSNNPIIAGRKTVQYRIKMRLVYQ